MYKELAEELIVRGVNIVKIYQNNIGTTIVFISKTRGTNSTESQILLSLID